MYQYLKRQSTSTLETAFP